MQTDDRQLLEIPYPALPHPPRARQLHGWPAAPSESAPDLFDRLTEQLPAVPRIRPGSVQRRIVSRRRRLFSGRR